MSKTSQEKRNLRNRLSEQQNHRCACCGVRMNDVDTSAQDYATLEHVMPLGVGGPNTVANLVMTCRQCNHKLVAWRQWVAFCESSNLPRNWHLGGAATYERRQPIPCADYVFPASTPAQRVWNILTLLRNTSVEASQ